MELFWVSFWEMRWSGGGLVEVIVVVTIALPMPPVVPVPEAVVCVNVCVGEEAANSLLVWKFCDWFPRSA